jgi:hypothetical protein
MKRMKNLKDRVLFGERFIDLNDRVTILNDYIGPAGTFCSE